MKKSSKRHRDGINMGVFLPLIIYFTIWHSVEIGNAKINFSEWFILDLLRSKILCKMGKEVTVVSGNRFTHS